MKRKYKQKLLFKITRAQIESIERQYWTRYNNDTIETMLKIK